MPHERTQREMQERARAAEAASAASSTVVVPRGTSYGPAPIGFTARAATVTNMSGAWYTVNDVPVGPWTRGAVLSFGDGIRTLRVRAEAPAGQASQATGSDLSITLTEEALPSHPGVVVPTRVESELATLRATVATNIAYSSGTAPSTRFLQSGFDDIRYRVWAYGIYGEHTNTAAAEIRGELWFPGDQRLGVACDGRKSAHIEIPGGLIVPENNPIESRLSSDATASTQTVHTWAVYTGEDLINGIWVPW